MKTTFNLIFISSQLNFNIKVVFIVLILTPVSVLIPISLKSNMHEPLILYVDVTDFNLKLEISKIDYIIYCSNDYERY